MALRRRRLNRHGCLVPVHWLTIIGSASDCAEPVIVGSSCPLSHTASSSTRFVGRASAGVFFNPPFSHSSSLSRFASSGGRV